MRLERRWHEDALSQRLPRGSWEIARRLMEDYRMADPAIVRADWDRDAALHGREMRLELRLWRVIGVHVRVRVTRVWDDERDVGGRRARVFGYEYEALRGHVEVGRMEYELYEFRDDGTVVFHLRARSRAADDVAPWIRLGFRLFGRRRQLRFYVRCCERMAELTAAELGRRAVR